MTLPELVQEFRQRLREQAMTQRRRAIYGKLLKRFYEVETFNADLVPPEMKHKNGVVSKRRVLLHMVETGEIIEGCIVTPKEDADGRKPDDPQRV